MTALDLLSAYVNKLELTLVQVKPYTQLRHGKVVRVSGYVYDTRTGRRITLPGASVPSGALARTAEADAVDHGAYERAVAAGSGHRAAVHAGAAVKELAHAQAAGNTGTSVQDSNIPDLISKQGGVTINPRSGLLVDVGSMPGFAIAVPHTEIEVGGKEGISNDLFQTAFGKMSRSHARTLAQADHYIGGYWSPARKKYVVELSQISMLPKNRAYAVGGVRNQEGILNMKAGEFLDTGGTGG